MTPYAHPDEAIRHLFRLHESIDSIRTNTGPQGVAGDRCKHCGRGPAITVSKRSITDPDPSLPGHWRKICFECRRTWEGVPWYEVAQVGTRQKSSTVTARPTGHTVFVPSQKPIEQLDAWLELDQVVEQLDLWRWRVYGVLYVGLAIGTNGPMGQKAAGVERRTAVGREAAKRWRHIPKNHTHEWGVRKLIREGRDELHGLLRERGLMAWGKTW